jgi:hypothetical protein
MSDMVLGGTMLILCLLACHTWVRCLLAQGPIAAGRQDGARVAGTMLHQIPHNEIV